MLAKPAGNPSQLCRPFRDVAPADIAAMLHDQLLNLVLKPANLLLRQRDLALSLPWPNQCSIECLRSKIGGEEGDGRKPDRFRCPYRSAKMAMVGFLHRRAAGNPEIRLSTTDLGHPLCNHIESSGDSPDAVMHFSRSVDRYDNVVEQRGNLV